MNSTREGIARADDEAFIDQILDHARYPRSIYMRSVAKNIIAGHISALKAEGYAVVGVEKVSATREAVVSSIAFLSRDWGTTRMVVTVPRITEMLTNADADLRAMLKAQEG